MLNIAIDLGRSSVKCLTDDQAVHYPFLMSFSKNETSNYLFVSAKDVMSATIGKEEIFFGDTARLVGSNIVQNTEGKFFMECSIKTYIFTTAWVLKQMAISDEPDVNLAINLTFDNYFMRADFVKAMKGKEFHITFFDKTEVWFTVKEMIVLYQGQSALFDSAMTKQLAVKDEYFRTEGVVCDAGRQTFDMLFVDSMQIREGKTKDLGTFKLYNHVIETLKKDFGIIKEVHDIEHYIQEGKEIRTIDGEVISVKEIVNGLVAKYFVDIDALFRSFLSKGTPDYLLLCGGGALLLGKVFQTKYRSCVIAPDPQWANARGLLKFLKRVLQP